MLDQRSRYIVRCHCTCVHFEWRLSRGNRYLWIVESARTPKGVRRVWQLYVGTAESLYRRLQRPGSLALKSFAFGKTAALLRAAQDTGLLAALEHHLPRRDQEGLSVAQILFAQLLGRAERSLSREQMASWFPDTALPLLWNSRSRPTSRTLLRYLRRLTETSRVKSDGAPVLSPERIHRIEEAVLRSVQARGLSLDRLLIDTTNFFTYHQTGGLHQKGHSKERRTDKNLVGLGLVTAGPLPILSELFPGDRADPKVFERVFETLITRLTRLEVPTQSMVVVFDRGMNSTDNLEEVLGTMHVIAALSRQEARTLFAHPRSEFAEVARDGSGRPILGFSTRWTGYGRPWRVIVTYRSETAHHQELRWTRTKEKVLGQVSKWRENLERGRAVGRSRKALMRKLVELIPKDYHGVFEYDVEVREGKSWPLCTVSAEAEERLRASWGKTAIITDLPAERLSDRAVVEGYVARAAIEDDFKWLKDRGVFSVKPVWVWNEASVRGHVFLCVMGLLLYRYLHWQAKDLGLSMPAMVDELEKIRVGAIRDSGGHPQFVVERMSRAGSILFSRLRLGEFLPS
jgi:transposase